MPDNDKHFLLLKILVQKVSISKTDWFGIAKVKRMTHRLPWELAKGKPSL
jgi:hypothetical protein